ncbi:MAG: AAA family ATPase [Candidatus Binataceae bacterium]
MATGKAYRFSSFRLDPHNWRLSKHNDLRPLRPKTFAVLRYLLDNAGRLVTKEDLFAAVWPDIKVAESALPVCMNELREALGDDRLSPRFVETVHRLGYRFIAPVDYAQDDEEQPQLTARTQPIVVGREEEMGRLLECWEKVLAGTRRVVFVVGESGIGKSTLVDKLLDAPQVLGFALVGRGYCAQQSEKGDTYRPIFEALAQMCGGRHGKEAREVILRQAPAWAAHMPQLLGETSNGADASRRSISTQMLMQFAATLDALAAMHPLILVCEDLHLSDRATVELIAYLAKRRDAARLMIVGTYRNGAARRDPAHLAAMVRELRAHRQCQSVRLTGLKQEEVTDYLRERIDESVAPRLSNQVHRRTGGNPLFLTAIVDHLESLGGSPRSWPDDLSELGVPDNVHAMIEQQVEELSDGDRKVLKLASVAGSTGSEFSSAALAAALEDEVSAVSQDEIEEQCEQLTRRVNFLRATGISQWPDGTVAASYAFSHPLYQEVLYAMMGAGQRARAHLRIAGRLEAAHGARAGTIAAELAMHFERADDRRRAALHWQVAAENAKNQGAAREALAQIDRALKLLDSVPRGHHRLQIEINCETTRTMALFGRRMAATKVEASIRRTSELARELGGAPGEVLVSQGITKFVLSPVESRVAEILIKVGLRQMESRSGGPAAPEKSTPLRLIARTTLSAVLNTQGKFRAALSQAERAIETDQLRGDIVYSSFLIQAAAESAVPLWFLGYPERAEKRALEAIAMGEKDAHAPALAFAIVRAATVYGLCREWEKSLALADRLIAFAADKDLQPWLAWAMFLRGAARTELGGLLEGCRVMRSALTELETHTGHPPMITAHARISLQYCEVRAGLLRPHEAIRFAKEAIDECVENGTAGSLAEMYRQLGLITAAQKTAESASHPEAEKWFKKALETARGQKAKSSELRSALELGRLWRSQGKGAQAHKLLSSIYRRFTEGRDTPCCSTPRLRAPPHRASPMRKPSPSAASPSR